MKKKYLVLILTIALLAVAIIGGTLASNIAESESATVSISEKSLGVDIINESNLVMDEETIGGDMKWMPGSLIDDGKEDKVNYAIMNQEKNSYDIYAQVIIYMDWVDKNGNEVLPENDDYSLFFENIFFEVENEEEAIPLVSSYEESKICGNWIVTHNDLHQVVLYYTKPLTEGMSSDAFLTNVKLSTKLDNSQKDNHLSIDMKVKAVQANNSDAAIAAEWGVFPVYGEDGTTLVGISETSTR